MEPKKPRKKSSRTLELFPVYPRKVHVVSVEDITPGMRRIVFAGELREHQRQGHTIPAIRSWGYDDDARLIFPDPTTGELPEVTLSDEGKMQWLPHLKQLFRTYTVREIIRDTAGQPTQVVVDFARHGSGLAENWSATAEPGDEIWMVGPKACRTHPAHRDWLLLCGDATEIPAISRCLEEFANSEDPKLRELSVIAIVDAAEPAHEYALAHSAATELRWVFRSEGQSFATAVAELFAGSDGALTLPEGAGFVWAAGEKSDLKQVRQVLNEFQGATADDTQSTDAPATTLAAEDIEFHGYWKADG